MEKSNYNAAQHLVIGVLILSFGLLSTQKLLVLLEFGSYRSLILLTSFSTN